MPIIDLNGLALYYEEEGKGEPLVLMHGAGSAIDDPWGSWAGLVGLFSQHFHTISVEHRGHGRTNNPDNTFDYATIANDITQLAEALALGRFHLAGVSDGAIVGLHLSMHRPELIRSLVLLGVNFRNDERTQRANASWSDLPSEPDSSPIAVVQSMRHDRAGKPLGSWRDLFHGLVENVAVNPDYSEESLTQIAAPTLLLAGENDDYANLDQLLTLRKQLPHAELCVINNAGHTVQFSHPHLVGPLVVDFLLRQSQQHVDVAVPRPTVGEIGGRSA